MSDPVKFSKPMLHICTTLLNQSYDLLQKFPNAAEEQKDVESVQYSIHYALLPIYVAFMQACEDGMGFTQDVIDAFYVLLDKIKQDLEKRVGDVTNLESVPYAFSFCINAVYHHLQKCLIQR